MRVVRSSLRAAVGKRCPTWYAIVLCLVSFLAGRIPWGNDRAGIQADPRHDASQLRLRGLAATSRASASYIKFPDVEEPFRRVQRVLNGNASFEDALKASGLTNAKPPIPAAASGDKEYTLAPFQVLSWYPRAIVFPKFIDELACKTFIDIATKRLAPSGLALRLGESEASSKNIRTSSGTFVASNEDSSGIIRQVEERIARITMLPASHGEAYNVLRYYLGQKYDSHYDTFNPTEYGPQRSQRAATVLLYLTTPEEGGETIFKLEGQKAVQVRDYVTCNEGLRYKPRQGDALLFWSLHPNKSFDAHALHGGCPVKKGVKWAATKWVHDLSLQGGD